MTELVAPGNLIDIDGYQMHYTHLGNSSPTIVMEAGFGASHLTWSYVRPDIEKFASVFTYDRAGLGWSEMRPEPRTTENIITELNKLLEAAGIPTPYILVGHSRGGEYVRQFTANYPEKVSGMVLVDSAHEQAFSRYPKDVQDIYRANTESFLEKSQQWAKMSHQEIVEAIKTEMPQYATILDQYPDGSRELAWDRLRPRHFEARASEFAFRLQNMDNGNKGLPVPNLGDLPLIVLYADNLFPLDIAEDVKTEYEQLLLEFQREFADLSTRSHLQHVPDAGHRIHADQPQVVIDAINKIYNMNLA